LLGIDRHLGAEPGNTPLYSGSAPAQMVCYSHVANQDRVERT
jgi:hypothetical protein